MDRHDGSGRWRGLVGIDVRSLAAFRIGLGLLLVYDLVSRSRDLAAHYTDSGILPRATLLHWRGNTGHLSLHLAGGDAWWVGLLFAAASVAAVALLLGYRTRAATIVSWALVVSLHARNPLVLHGGDALLRVLLFWAMFLPLGVRWSLDSASRGRGVHAPVVSVATAALLVQVCLVYWVTAILKLHPIWLEQRTAVEMALRLDQLATGWGRLLLEAPPALLRGATTGTLVWELLGPVLVWLPIATARFRTVVVGAFWIFHLVVLAPALALGIFPWVAAVAWIPFLPARFWRENPVGSVVATALSRLWRSPRPGAGRRRRRDRVSVLPWGQAVAAAALALVLLWNLRTIAPDRYAPLVPPTLVKTGQALGLEQRWDLFAPHPAIQDGWLSAPGILASGAAVDVLTGSVPTDEKPDPVWRHLGRERQRKLAMQLTRDENASHRRGFARWLCRSWNRSHPPSRRLESVRIVFHLETTDPQGPTELPPVALPLWTQLCRSGFVETRGRESSRP